MTEIELRVTTEELTAAIKERDDILAVVSHDLRTPISLVVTATELARREDLSEAKRDEQLAILGRAGRRMERLVNDLTQLTRMEAGHLDLSRRPTPAARLLNDAATGATPTAEEARVEIRIRPLDPDLTVDADSNRIGQVLDNLLGNAIKFTNEGEVSLTVTGVEANGASRLRFEVADTGIGIPQELQHRIFDSFSQADDSTTRKYGGTGLGLSIAKMLCEAMRGSIGVDSAEEEGTTFWCEVTLERGDGPAHADEGDRCAELRDSRILVVDGNSTRREAVRRMTRDWGMHPLTAESGAEALRALGSEEPDILLIDSELPDMHGLELASRIRDLGHGIPHIALLTPVGATHARAELSGAGISTTFRKPICRPRLLEDLVSLVKLEPEALQEMPEPDPGPAGKPASTRAGTDLDLHVLLAEDNLVNQEVARRMLEQIGCRVDVVDNGRDAIWAARRSDHDLILMDCRMPEVDGYEATRQIRERERESGLPRTPIIAVTANVLAADRQVCIEAGMDDHLGKPYEFLQLRRVIEAAVARTADRPDADRERPHDESPTGEDETALDESALDASVLDDLRSMGREDKPDLLARLGDLYLHESVSQMDELREAVSAGDGDRIDDLAHSLKSSSANIGARRLATLFRKLEYAAHDPRPEVEALLAEIETELRAVRGQLEDLREETRR